MKIVGVEEHFLTQEVRDAWGTAPPESSSAFALRMLSPPMKSLLDDLSDERVRRMDETGLDVQVLSVMSPALHDLGKNGASLAQRTNDLVAATIARRPDRFEGLATLPMGDPPAAVRELERAVRELKMKGVMLCGRSGDRNLDHEDFLPVLERCADLNVPILMHPQIPQQKVREAYYSGFGGAADVSFSAFGLGWHYEAGIQVARLVLGGVFDRLPTLQVIMGHWGEAILFFWERLAMMERSVKLQRPIADYPRQNLYVTGSGMFHQTYLQRAIEIVGPDRILFSTDYPYRYHPGREARLFLEQAPLDAETKEKFAHKNWERLTASVS